MGASPDQSPPAVDGAGRPERVTIAPAVELADFAAVAALQERIWGGDNTVPVPHLIAAAHAGGTVLVARDGSGTILGFCYGFVGLDIEAGLDVEEPTGVSAGDHHDGPGPEPILWSHMLGVDAPARGQGLGRRLKQAQADAARRLGLRRILWTFDPLEARNAYLNLRVLGARAGRYDVDRYGHMDDPLNAGLDSDRLIADWDVTVGSATGRVRHVAAAPVLDPPVLNPDGASGEVATPGASDRAVRIAIPAGHWRADQKEARLWRQHVRTAFTGALAAGYVAVDLEPGDPLSHYLLVRA